MGKHYLPPLHRLGKMCATRLGMEKYGGTSPYSLAAKVLVENDVSRLATQSDKVYVKKNWRSLLNILGVSTSECGKKGRKGTAKARTVSWQGVDSQRRLSGPVTVVKYENGIPTNKPLKPAKTSIKVRPDSDAFLESYEWRRLRLIALKMHGRRCQCCGATPETGAVMNVDHIKPRKIYPELALDIGNLQVLCHLCNHGKGNWDMTDWRPEKQAVGNG